MFGFRRRWRFQHLVVAWSAYWAALIATKLGGAIVAGWYLSNLPPDHATVNVGFNDTILRMTMLHDANPIWSGRASIAEIVVWVAGPPLILWGIWLARASRARVAAAPAAPAASELGAGDLAVGSRRAGEKADQVERG